LKSIKSSREGEPGGEKPNPIKTNEIQERSWTRYSEDMIALLPRSTRSGLTHRCHVPPPVPAGIPTGF